MPLVLSAMITLIPSYENSKVNSSVHVITMVTSTSIDTALITKLESWLGITGKFGRAFLCLVGRVSL